MRTQTATLKQLIIPHLIVGSSLGRRGGGRPWYKRDPALAARIAALRLQNFHETLRAGRRLGMISRLRRSMPGLLCS